MKNTTRTMRELRSVAQMVERSFHRIFLMKIQFYHVTWAQKLFFIAIFEKIRSKYIGLNRLDILKLTKENQAFCTCPSLIISSKRLLKIAVHDDLNLNFTASVPNSSIFHLN